MNEITVVAGLGVKNGSLVIPTMGQQAFRVTQAVVGGGGPGVIDVPIIDTVIDLSGFTAPGMTRITNLDTTNFVLIGPDDGVGAMVPFLKLLPGESQVFRFDPAATLIAKADTAPAKIHLVILES